MAMLLNGEVASRPCGRVLHYGHVAGCGACRFLKVHANPADQVVRYDGVGCVPVAAIGGRAHQVEQKGSFGLQVAAHGAKRLGEPLRIGNVVQAFEYAEGCVKPLVQVEVPNVSCCELPTFGVALRVANHLR